MAGVTRMTKEERRGKLDRDDMNFLDIREENGFSESEEQIEGAVRESPEKISFWMEKYPRDTALILY